MKLQNKTALVTGASRGLGRATAIELAKAGATIIINHLDDEQNAQETLKLVKEHTDGEIIQADVANPIAVKAMAKQLCDKYGQIDILVNNAGAILRPGFWDTQSDEDLNRTIDINLKGQLNCMRAFAPAMQKAKWGRIINISSTNGQTGTPAILAYSAAKAGVINATYAMAKALGPDGVTVNSVSPGVFNTDMTKGAPEEVTQSIIKNTPLGRLGKPEEIGEAVRFLVEADFITGHVLVVDGGLLLNT
jgi:3-oxoacyl-[acyl-carrier protein] reductase